MVLDLYPIKRSRFASVRWSRLESRVESQVPQHVKDLCLSAVAESLSGMCVLLGTLVACCVLFSLISRVECSNNS